MRRLVLAALIASITLVPSSSSFGADGVEARSLDGSGNNVANPNWGKANTPYLRLAPANYADHVQSMVAGPPARYVSNRIFNDIGTNVFSENNVSQWGWLWGQFLDHTFGLRDEHAAESAPIPYASPLVDPLERFKNDFSTMSFARTPAAPGTGVGTTVRQQINTVSSYIDAFAVYGGAQSRLDWLRDGASLLLPNRFLPRANARGNVATAPAMDLMGPLEGNAAKAVVAGDVRANENIGLTAVHTLFAREHNRIVAALPDTLSDEDKFQIARRVVGAEEQYITYQEFLPAMGVTLPAYGGYKTDVDATLSDEFATVGYRAHSQIHGEMEPTAPAGRWTAAQLDGFRHQGSVVEEEGGRVTVVIPLGVTFGNPDLLEQVGVGPLLKGLAAETEYKNDEQIDDSLRSILFQIPKPGALDPAACGEPAPNPACFSAVQDLGAIDVQRGRDHGMPYYNDLRVRYGLPRKTSFTALTGESTDAYPADSGVDNPNSLAFTGFVEDHGIVVGAQRYSSLAARLSGVYPLGVDTVDAFTGMVSEPHVAGTEFGELQLAIWKKQFAALRDGDRFFYANDGYLDTIRDTYGIDYRHSLADVIEMNTGVDVQPDVFHAPPDVEARVPGLVAAYGFDEGDGTAVGDSSGLGNDGIARDPAWVDGKFGQAISFNGSTSWVTIPDRGPLDLVDGMTLEAWVKPSALGAKWRTVVFKQRPGGSTYGLYANTDGASPDGQVQIGGEQNTAGPARLPLDTWTHLAVTYDGANVDLYVNGALVASTPQAGSIDVSTNALRIGGNSVWPEWFKGAIDEVRVYNRPLDADEIQEDMVTAVASVPVPEVAAPALGDRRVEPDANAEPVGTAEAFPSTAAAAATIHSLNVYLDASAALPVLHVGVYSDNAGHPGRLLAESAYESPLAGAWNTVALPALELAAGTRYWIAVLAPEGSLVFRDRCCSVAGSGPTEQSAQTSLRGLPATWTPGARWDDAPMSIYAAG